MIPKGTETYRIIGVPTKVGFFLQGDGPIPADLLTDRNGEEEEPPLAETPSFNLPAL